MSQLDNLTGKKFNHWTVLEELRGGKVLCQCDCGTTKVIDKYSVKKGKSESCGCSKKHKSLVGQTFNYWTVIEDRGSINALCRCQCGTIKEVQIGHLKNGSSKSCGCMQVNKIVNNLEGKKINYLTVIKELGDGKVKVRCDCGKEYDIEKYHLTQGHIKSCGCMSSELKRNAFLNDLTNKVINEWTVLEELGHGKVKCKCSCGNIRIIEKASIINGKSKSCGHNEPRYGDLTGKIINNWEVLYDFGYGCVLCKCICGTKRILQKTTLLNGSTKSCGCLKTTAFKETMMNRYGETTANRANNPREEWQIKAVSSKENMVGFIKSTFEDYKPTIFELNEKLNISIPYVGRLIKNYEIEDYINIRPLQSSIEKEIVTFIKSVYNGKIETSVRDKLGNTQEIDIYIPDLKIGIEYNGNYWHSSIYKDVTYHQDKTIRAAKNGIRLIQIFEYEWKNEETQRKIKGLLERLLNNKSIVRYAREFEVVEVDNTKSNEFLNKYHLQGSINSGINIALVENNQIYGLMTFGKPRFNYDYDWELYRLCFDNSVNIVGGTERMFKYFSDKHKGETLITYCDISKFTGNVYTRLGFKPIQPNSITKPNYVWVSLNDSTNVMLRYQTQKKKLVELGLGDENETEETIMERLEFVKIYDSGNLRLQIRM